MDQRRLSIRVWRLFLLCAVAVALLLPATTVARERARPARNWSGVEVSVQVTCLGARGATVVVTVTNVGDEPRTLVELSPRVTFPHPATRQESAGLEVFILLIPTTIAPGETWTYGLPVTDEMLPPFDWVTFHNDIRVDVGLWFTELPRPIARRFFAGPCEPPA